MSNPSTPPPTFGSNRPNNLAANAPKPTSTTTNPFNRSVPPQPPQPASLSRFGVTKTTLKWTVQPHHAVAVRFDLKGLGDPFHRLLHTELNLEYGAVEKVSTRLTADEETRLKLTELLDNAWQTYAFKGAVLLYPTTDEVKKAYTSVPLPIAPIPPQKSDEEEEDFSDPIPVPPTKAIKITCLRAIDLTLVLNVLARTRAHILASDTALALEPAFIEQSYICDDPRIVQLARATGTLEESWG